MTRQRGGRQDLVKGCQACINSGVFAQTWVFDRPMSFDNGFALVVITALLGYLIAALIFPGWF